MPRFFGIVRCFKGDEDHPSITQFSHIYRLLSLYMPLKTAIKGNCTGPCDSVLVSFQDSLGLKAKAAAELKTTIESKLHKKLQCIMSFDTQDSLQLQRLGHGSILPVWVTFTEKWKK